MRDYDPTIHSVTEAGYLALRSYREAAKELGIDRRALPYLVAALGIVPKPIRHNGHAKGLDEADMRRLRKVKEKRAKLSAA